LIASLNLSREKAATEPAMVSIECKHELQQRAIEALKSALSSVSAIKLIEVHHQPAARLGKLGFLAFVNVFGHLHALACEVKESIHQVRLRASLDELRNRAEGATPVLIAPYLSLDTQSTCKECRTAFVDFEGNARMLLGEVFIGRRSMPRLVPDPISVDIFLRESAQLPLAHPAVFAASDIPRETTRVHRGISAGSAVA
jgi:hypothetical protein